MLRIVNNPPIIRVRLKYPDVLSFTYRYAHRLTSKGLFLVVKTPSLPGAQVRFELLLEGGDIVFAGLGEITWIKPFPDSKGFYGMIIRFITLDEGCQEILQLALSQKDVSRKDAFDHQKIAEDPLPDDQIDTTPFISAKRQGNIEPTTNRYYSVQANPAAPQGNGFDSPENVGDDWAPAEEPRALSEDPQKVEPFGNALGEPEDEFEEDPTEDTLDRRTKRAPSLRSLNAAPDHAPTHRNPSLALIDELAAQQQGPRLSEDASDITTGENLHFPKPSGTFNKIVFGDDDVPTDTSTKQFILPKVEEKPEEPLVDEEDASLEFVSKRQEPSTERNKSSLPALGYVEEGAARTPTKPTSGSEEPPKSPSKPISGRMESLSIPSPQKITENAKSPFRSLSNGALPPIKYNEEKAVIPQSRISEDRPAELDATDLGSRDSSPSLPKEESSSSRNLAFASTDELSIFPNPKETAEEPLPVPGKEFKSKTQTKKTRPITQNDPPTNIRILIAKPIPTVASEQDAEMERLAHEAGLADLEALVGWSKELIKNLPRTPAHIERELMALAIASKKLY